MKKHSLGRRMVRTLAALAAPMLLLFCHAAPAQGTANASGNVHLYVPYPPGGSTDALARKMAARLAEGNDQSFIVENRAGGNNVIAARALMGRPADGKHIVIHDLAMFSINPWLFSNLAYTPESFQPVNILTQFAFVLLVNNESKYDSFQDLLEDIKNKPEAATYGSAGLGNPTHLVMELLKAETGMNMTHTPYKGGGPAINDLMGGHVDTVLMDIPGAFPYIQSKRLKPLVVTSAERHPLLPDVPTVAEAGYPGAQFSGWFGASVLAETPAPVVTELNETLAGLMTDPEMTEFLASITMTPAGQMTAAEAEAQVRSDAERLGALIKKLELSLD